ncbi:MAG: hypothetical protein PVF52_01110 [Granulosicoccaceae bacterium]|jgi:hypothetical protein
MRIYMQTPIPDSGSAPRAPRFCHLIVQEDMLAGWSLIKETGYQGGSGRVTRTHFNERDSAVQALLKERDRQLTNGYNVVFIEGQIQ